MDISPNNTPLSHQLGFRSPQYGASVRVSSLRFTYLLFFSSQNSAFFAGQQCFLADSNTFHAVIVNWQEMVSYWLPLPGNKERITRYCVSPFFIMYAQHIYVSLACIRLCFSVIILNTHSCDKKLQSMHHVSYINVCVCVFAL